ncbi:MAG: hypothetical protein K6A32_00090 [Bacteroidales bacterium]|nr:hypothetical protein [Bacteroidales bacterium]
MNELNKPLLRLQSVGALLMVLGAALFMLKPLIATICYTIGAVIFCPIQMLQSYEGKNFVIRRLRRQQLLGLIALLCAACCMIMQVGCFGFARRNEWVICLVIGCILELYTAFRIPAELEKEDSQK